MTEEKVTPTFRLAGISRKAISKSVFRYMTILFAAAFILLGLAFVMEQRSSMSGNLADPLPWESVSDTARTSYDRSQEIYHELY